MTNVCKRSLIGLIMCLCTVAGFGQSKLTGTVLGQPGDGQWGQNKAFDGDLTNYFDVAGDIGDNHGWVGLALPSATVIAKVRFYPRVDGENTYPLEKNDGGMFQGSHTADFAVPVTLATISMSQMAIASWTDIPVTNTESFEYVRYLAPDLSGNTGGMTSSNCTVGEIEFYAAVAPPENIALKATVSTSFVSEWESLDAVKDGIEPANSMDRPNGAYGNWNSANTMRWVQYEWSTPATLSGTDVYWWTDGQGILIPTEAYVEYYNVTNDTWVKVGDIGKTADQYNYLGLGGITTTKIRIHMINDVESTGIIEWKAYGEVADPIPTGKIVYIPNEWKSAAANIPYDLATRSAQSDNFIVVWGPLAGTDPKNNTNPELKFDPVAVLDSMEVLYDFYVKQLHEVEEKGNLAKYKMIVVVNNTWREGLYTGWAFGGGFDNVIGAMFVDPRSMSENSWVISHEITHSFQYMIPILYPGHGYTDVSHAGFFWETHANFMAIQKHPSFITATDYPRAMNFTNYYIGSPRKHYGDWYILQYLKDKEGIGFINRIWQESNQPQKEHPMEAIRRLLGKTQPEMNDMMLEYAMKRVKGDFSNKALIQQAETSIERQYLWKKTTVLDSLGEGHYAVPDRLAPQQYGFNIIRLYAQSEDNCPDKYVYLNFKSHAGVNGIAGWRYGFVSVDAGGTTTFGNVLQGDAETVYKVPGNSAELYLVVLGAPTTYQVHDGRFEVGFPKLPRFPYEINIKGAIPEGYQPDFRHVALPAGARHANGGGFVASTAHVEASAYVGPNAVVLDRAQVSGAARIEGKAWVRDDARVSGNAVVGDFAIVSGNAAVNTNGKVFEQGQIYSGTVITGNAQVKGNAVLFNNNLSGAAQAYGNALSMSGTFSGTFEMGGDAEIGETCAAGKYLQMPWLTSAATVSGRPPCDGVIDHELNVDVNQAYTVFTDEQVEFAKSYACGEEVSNLPRRTINFPALERKRLGDAAVDLSAVSSTGEEILYTSSDPLVAEVIAGKLIIKGVGTTTISATVPLNQEYANKPTVQQVFVVGKTLQTITAKSINELNISAKKASLEVSSTSGLPVSLKVDNGWVAWLSGTDLMLKSPGTVTVTAAQPGNEMFEAAASVVMTIRVNNEGGDLVKVNKAVSPNNDGINDILNVEGIENYVENTVSILSSSGKQVFRKSNYNNTTVLFDGRDNNGLKLPAGTYFYVIQLKENGKWNVVKGYLTLGY